MSVSVILAALSCARTPVSVESAGQDPVDISLALTVSDKAEPQTKVSSTVVTEIADNPDFRGMTDIVMVPFGVSRTIAGDDDAIHQEFPIPSIGDSKDASAISGGVYHSGLVINNHSHLYPRIELPRGTASVLVYGHAPGSDEDIESKHAYGSLIPEGFDGSATTPSAEDFRFCPDQIYAGGVPAATIVLLYLLNSVMFGSPDFVMPAYYNDENGDPVSANQPVIWTYDYGDTFFQELYQYMSNGGLLISGAGKSVETRLKKLYADLKGYTSVDNNTCSIDVDGIYYPLLRADNGEPLRNADLYNGLRNTLIARIEALDDYLDVTPETATLSFKSDELLEFPGNLGLPDGSAVIRWTPSGYIRPADDGLDGIAPAHRFCYPPALYYFNNTTVKTSEDASVLDYYSSTSDSWQEDILANYTAGTVVTSASKHVALVDPMQYAVGMLRASVRASAQTLADDDGSNSTNVLAVNHNLKVTGVIIASQYKQFFNFYADNTGKEYYLYDNQIQDAWLTTSADTAPFRCTVLQTPKDEDVYFCLELQNNTGTDFFGAEGRIVNGQKFYLAGVLVMPSTRSVDYAFMQDHRTMASCEIQTLEHAYTSVPDLKDPQLYIGVQAQVNWIESNPTIVTLD
ncbi:MAG: hypothetical protein VZQ48_01425 [Candidatus Cryptobacteroides sp.]|nr:hypothetical protein [Candidatus Cryptobacteroides sp.]